MVGKLKGGSGMKKFRLKRFLGMFLVTGLIYVCACGSDVKLPSATNAGALSEISENISTISCIDILQIFSGDISEMVDQVNIRGISVSQIKAREKSADMERNL